MEDVRWFQNLLTNYSEDIWRMGQISRELQEYRQEIQFQWNDAASRELNPRYLNPHQEDDQKMLAMLHTQIEKFEMLTSHLITLYEILEKVNALSFEVEKLLEKVKIELKRGYSNYDVYKENYSLSKNELPKVYDLIDRANSMGR